MKIYFHCSMLGKNKYQEEYKAIIEALQDLNHKVFYEHIFRNDYEPVSKKTKIKVYDEIQDKKRLIKLCDAVIVETTQPSIGVGYIIAQALGQHKNVLMLFQDSPHAVLVSEKNRLLVLKRYDNKNIQALKHDLESFLNRVEKNMLKYRFNMMIDQSLNDFLKRESNKQHISKADYVRRLIFENLTQHE